MHPSYQFQSSCSQVIVIKIFRKPDRDSNSSELFSRYTYGINIRIVRCLILEFANFGVYAVCPSSRVTTIPNRPFTAKRWNGKAKTRNKKTTCVYTHEHKSILMQAESGKVVLEDVKIKTVPISRATVRLAFIHFAHIPTARHRSERVQVLGWPCCCPQLSTAETSWQMTPPNTGQLKSSIEQE